MRKHLKVTSVLLFLLCIAALGAVAPDLAQGQIDYQDYNPSGGGGGGCPYCSQPQCGCSPPPSGSTLQFSCACSSIQCTRSCSYS